MNVRELVDDIKRHGFTDTSDSTLVALINDAIWDIDSREQWPYLDAITTLSFSAGDPSPTNMPSDFSKMISLINESTGVVLEPTTRSDVAKKFSNQLNSQGEPLLYYFVGNTLYVYPTPSSNMSLSMNYVRSQPKLNISSPESSILMPPKHHRIIVLRVLGNLYAQEDDIQFAQYFNTEFSNRLSLMAYDLWTVQYDRPDIISVSFEDFIDYLN